MTNATTSITDLVARVQKGVDGQGYPSHSEITVGPTEESFEEASFEDAVDAAAYLAGILARAGLSLAAELRKVGNGHCSGLRCGVEGIDLLTTQAGLCPVLVVTVPTRDIHSWFDHVEAAVAEASTWR